MNKLNQLVAAITNSPFFWGLLGSAGFYALVHAGPLGIDIIKRYFTHHPVEYMLTVMFSVGLAALLIKAVDVVRQRSGLDDSLLPRAQSTPQSIDQCDALLARLERIPARRQHDYYVSRLRAGLEHVQHRGSAELLDDELKYLADVDASRLYAGYGLFRVIVWAIPILGFLGTVIGITMMLGGAAQIANGSDPSAMFKIFEGLSLKFDTTALALTLSMVLMFVHFSVEHSERSLLDQVDRHVQEELADRFMAISADGDGQLVAMRSMVQAMLQATEVLLRRQTELWQASVDAAAQHWAQMAVGASDHVKTAMAAAGSELAKRAEVLERAIVAAGEVTRLEDALNRNLTTLAGARHFEQTALSLAAAVNMLSARLAEAPNTAAPIRLEPMRRAAQAA